MLQIRKYADDPGREASGLPSFQVQRNGQWVDADHSKLQLGELIRYKRWPQFGTFRVQNPPFKHIRYSDQLECWVVGHSAADEIAAIVLHRLCKIMNENEELMTYDALALLEAQDKESTCSLNG